MKKLFILCGISFAGKSTLAKAIAERFNYAEVDIDDVKCQLYGSDIQDEDLSREDWIRTYAETDHLIEYYLKTGKDVIDASRNFRKEERQLARQIASKLDAEVVVIFVDVPEIVARQRLLENRKKQSRRNVVDEDFEAIIQAMDPPTADENPLVFHYGDQVENWISKNISVFS